MACSIRILARIITLTFCLSVLTAQPVWGQGSAFTYQGALNNNNVPGNGNFDFEFKLFDLLATGIQQGATIQRLNVPVTNGNFTVTLDFGAAVFSGAPRFLEIGVRAAGGGAFTVLTPRQQITATPYAIKAVSASSADGLSAACVGCVTSTQIQGGGAYINNSTTQQAGANFNIGGNGTIGGNLITNGNVGIGTLNPQNKLHVNGDGIRYDNGGKTLYISSGSEVDVLSPTNSVVIQSTGTVGHNHVVLSPFATDGSQQFRNGNVGIGVFNPQNKLHVNGDGIRYDNGGKTLYISSGSEVDVLSPTNSVVIQSLGPVEHNHVILSPFATDGSQPFRNGYVGVGTFFPLTKLHVEDNALTETTIRSRTERAILALDSNLGGQQRVWTLESGIFGQAGRFGIYDRTAQRERLGIGPDGVVGIDVLQIRGGADFSENFDVNAAPVEESEATVGIEPGMVVSIDPANPGKLLLSSQAYDRRVAGIISGAGGVRPGMMMSQEGTLAHGSHPVALSGRVYCLVDASQGAIEPGDLLTTSNLPGYAMKVADPAKAQGAIIGKAMTPLSKGKGLVLVLVSLQ